MRRLSAGIFGNEKLAEVVVALCATRSGATAQELSLITRISHSMVRDVLVRLVAVGLVTPLPKAGGTRSAQYYVPAPGEGWGRLSALAEWVVASAGDSGPATTTARLTRIERGAPAAP